MRVDPFMYHPECSVFQPFMFVFLTKSVVTDWKVLYVLSALLSSTVPTLFMHSGTLQGKLIFEEDKQMMNS